MPSAESVDFAVRVETVILGSSWNQNEEFFVSYFDLGLKLRAFSEYYGLPLWKLSISTCHTGQGPLVLQTEYLSLGNLVLQTGLVWSILVEHKSSAAFALHPWLESLVLTVHVNPGRYWVGVSELSTLVSSASS